MALRIAIDSRRRLRRNLAAVVRPAAQHARSAPSAGSDRPDVDVVVLG
jgi:hypothetical protein